MRNRILAALAFAAAAASPALAQGTFELVGKVVDADGNPVRDAQIAIYNKDNPAVRREGTSDKRGNFWIDGVLYSQQNRFYEIEAKAEGMVPHVVKLVGRMGSGTIYEENELKLAGDGAPFEVRVQGVGELRTDITLGPPREAAPAPAAAGPGPAAGAAQPETMRAAFAKLQARDFEGAADLLKTAVEEAPDDAERREWYAQALLRLDRSGEALLQAKKAVDAAPDRISARLVLADAQAATGQLPKAAATLAEAKALAPDDPKVLQRLAWVATEGDDLPAAIGAYESLVRLNPGDKESWVALGDLYARQGNAAKSEAAYQKVTELDPENAYRTFYNLGALIENRDNLTEADNRKAVEAFRKATEIKPDYAIAFRHLGYALLRTGDLPGAKKALQRYLELEPKAADAGEIRATVKSLP